MIYTLSLYFNIPITLWPTVEIISNNPYFSEHRISKFTIDEYSNENIITYLNNSRFAFNAQWYILLPSYNQSVQ